MPKVKYIVNLLLHDLTVSCCPRKKENTEHINQNHWSISLQSAMNSTELHNIINIYLLLIDWPVGWKDYGRILILP